jgi:hypothetical protein
MVNRNYGTADPTTSGNEQNIHDEESPLLPTEIPNSKVQPLVGVGTIIAVLLLGAQNKVSLPVRDLS